MFSSFLIDLNNKGQLDTNQKVYVVELGTGSGKFSFHFLQAVKHASRKSITEASFVM